MTIIATYIGGFHPLLKREKHHALTGFPRLLRVLTNAIYWDAVYVLRRKHPTATTPLPKAAKAGNGNNDLVQIVESHSMPAIPNTPERLTPREIEVLRLMADGLTTKAIANGLGVAFKTAACHRARILQKLDCESTVLAVRWAIRNGVAAA